MLSDLVCAGDESPTFNGRGPSLNGYLNPDGDLPNTLSAPFEVPHFPIEQIENKLLMQRQLSSKYVCSHLRVIFTSVVAYFIESINYGEHEECRKRKAKTLSSTSSPLNNISLWVRVPIAHYNAGVQLAYHAVGTRIMNS